MNRNYIVNKAANRTSQEVKRKVAIHAAGHAASIYLGNKQKALPPVFFQILITPPAGDFPSFPLLSRSKDTRYKAQVDGGRLIHTLSSSIEEATNGFSSVQKMAYQRAFEADIINLLVGPLSEAKYVKQRDGELIHPQLIYLNALHCLGGTAEIEDVNEYLECFAANAELNLQKLTALFLEAFSFVNKRSNWHAISVLADYIVCDEKPVIECDEIISVLETACHEPTSRFGVGHVAAIAVT